MAKTQKIAWNRGQWRLALLWLSSGAIVFLLLLAMSIGGKFDYLDAAGKLQSHNQEAWGWFLATMMPILTLIVGVLVADAGTSAAKRPKLVDFKFYRLAMYLSGFNIFVVIATLIATSVPENHRGIEMLRMSNLWLGPLQGLASAALGVFYMRAQTPE